MRGRPIGITLLSGAALAASLVGMAALWTVWPRNANTSPLAALFAGLWSCTYLVAAILMWRRSHLAGVALVAAVALLLFPASFLFPGGQAFLPGVVVVALLALGGYRYLRNSVALAA